MLFSYVWLQEFIKTQLPKPEKLADDLALHVFEVEGIEKAKNDTIVDVKILPQRGDCLSHMGLGREIAAIEKKELLEPERALLKAQEGTLDPLKVSIENREFVPRYTALVVEGVSLGSSPQWMQERLESLGINAINNVVDTTNYIMLELGQPLHAFDFSKIQGYVMNIRGARAGERLTLLDETEIILPKGVLVIEDQNRLIDLAGIKGGKVSSIGKGTRNIVLQAAVFDREKIYQTKKQINYRTTAADIYSHGVDPNLAKTALERALFLLQKYGGGKLVQVIDIYPKPVKPTVVQFSSAAAEKLLGVSIPKKETDSILKRLGFKVQGQRVSVPTWRADVMIPEDLVEEVGRLHGLEAIPATFPHGSVVPPEENQDRVWLEQLRDNLKEVGFVESYNYSFVGEKDVTTLGYSEKDASLLVALQNPMSEDFKYLRMNLLDNLLKNIVLNERAFPDKTLKFFETEKVFAQTLKGVEEELCIAFVLAPPSRTSKAFLEAKGIVDSLFSSLGITDAWYDEFKAVPDKGRNALWQEAKRAEIKIGNAEIGFLGEISSSVLNGLGMKRQVVAMELNVKKLLTHALEEREYRPPSKFPPALQDIALLVPRDVRVEDVVEVMERSGGELVADIDLFDMYEGSELPEGKKSLAFHIVYQAEDRTLTGKEVETVHKIITQALEENPGWEVR
ncbi:MAG: phenylalanine--tRNA ligase subunit beta [Candidatus Wildermuthbacteria bacterium RIFCSPLOWO2_01_FULL_47_18]|uniref:Phenylalanine--tRNA ligase beta subunit n=1 Tax=Candidatus Wildermuthbacteria bacterium RIFCSPLOWO2_01_FULL_47_18 TaxID=1802460 RepID=A0A1G2RKB5_9BACT|nr:MAG: phenylalanine--tRNA ligase subunit beta [Candidatus Wildermuthbacteria bacterium RIFCSPLOWO2_01_FULL_47_18]